MFDDMKAVIDVGSSKITVFIGKYDRQNKEIEILGFGKCDSEGLRNGTVINLDVTARAISIAVEKAETMSGGEIRGVTVGIAGSHIRSLESDGVTAVANQDEITYADINRAIEAARALKVPLDNEILHVIPKDFKIDGQSGIKDPTNMSGVRLEVKVHIITGAVNSAHNIIKTVNKADFHVDNIVMNPIASSLAVLSEEEQNLGVILIDLGAGTADIAAYVNSNIIHTSSYSMGGDQITKDISRHFRISLKEAEQIKKKFGMAMTDLCDPEKEIEISVFGTEKKKHIKQIELVNIIQTRLIEIFEFLKHKIISNELYDKAICGLVLTGGVCELKGTAELCEKILELPVKTGKPLNVTGINEQIKSPAYATGIGLLKYSFENESQKIGPSDDNLFDRIIQRLRDMFVQIFLKF